MGIRFARPGVVLVLFLLLVACGEGSHSRLGPLLGMQQLHHRTDQAWPRVQRIGLALYSDMAWPGAAPSIVQPFLDTLSRRTEEFLTRRCGVASVVPIAFPASTQRAQMQKEFTSRGQEIGIAHLLLVVLSSREHSGPVTLGEERMMTQMSGTAVENTALAEVALVRLADYGVTIVLPGWATETLELLDVPIGLDQPTREHSLEILRAQAGQQALDQALHVMGKWCERIPEKD